MESILNSVKNQIGIVDECTDFDKNLIMHINSVFFILWQLGVGPSKPFSITNETSIWSDFIPEGQNIEAVKSYVYLKVQLLFDPPSSSALMEAKNRQISELEWRLNAEVDIFKTQTKEVEP